MGRVISKEGIRAALRTFVLKQFPAARKRGLQDHDSLLVNGIVDSLGILEIVTFIESEFHITVMDDELLSNHFESIESLAEMIDRKLYSEESSWTS